MILVAENEDVIIVKNPLCTKCVENRVNVNMIKMFLVDTSEVLPVFKTEIAYAAISEKYIESTWKPRLLKIACNCK